MSMVRLQHPKLDEVTEVPAEAVGQWAMAGWVPAEGEPVPTCPTCGSVWPAYADTGPPEKDKTDEAPAEETGASASKKRAARRSSSEETS